MTIPPANILRLMSASDRAKLGKAGMLPDELHAVAVAKSEKELQSSIRQYLRLHQIEFICPDMRKRSALPPGWTDFTFCYRGVPLAVECKIDDEEPRKDQAEMHGKLKRNGWVVLVVRSLAEIQDVFRRIDSSLAGKELTVTSENAESRGASAD